MSTLKILCVDDDPAMLRLYQTLLESTGYIVSVADDAFRAMDFLGKRGVDAVVLDYEMPGMNGADLAEKVKMLRPGTPVVMVSGRSSDTAPKPKFVDTALNKGTSVCSLPDILEHLTASARQQMPRVRYTPLGSALATVALAAYLIPRIWR